MAKSQEIAQINEINQGLTTLNTTINGTVSGYLALVAAVDKSTPEMKGLILSFAELSKAQKEVTANQRQLDSLGKQLAATEKKLKEIEDPRLKLLIQKKIALQDNTKALKDEVKAEGLAETSLVRMRQKLSELTKAYDQSGTRTKAAAKEINNLSKEIQKAEDATNRHGRGVGNYAKSILSAVGIMASGTAVIAAFFAVIKNGFQTSIAFEKAMSDVKAVSGATKEEFAALRDEALKLGSSTKYTAVEVSGLQKEYAKLGFSALEISLITKATVELATATGEDLASSATIAGATLRQFNLDASKMQMVVDVITMALNKSSLDLTKFATAMQYVGPVANAVGENLQSTSAKLSVLANAGIEASISGTSLRNIYLELEKSGMTWEEAVTKIEGSETKASVALELFGKRGAVAALILASNTKAAKDFETAYNNAAGEAERVSGIMLDNVASSLKILKSQWEGLTIRVNETNGALKTFIDNISVIVSGVATKGKKDLDSLFEPKIIDSFNDRFKFFVSMGVGYWKAAKMARVNDNEETQKLADEFTAIGEKRKTELDEITAKKLEADAVDKKTKEDELKRIQALIDAEDKKNDPKTVKKQNKDKEAADDDLLKLRNLQINTANEIDKKGKKESDDIIKQFQDNFKQEQEWELDALIEGNDRELNAIFDKNQKELDDDKKTAEERKKIAEELRDIQVQMASEAVNGIFDLNASKLSNEISSIEKERDVKLSNEKLTSRQKEKINEEYDKKVNAIKTKQAKADKLQSLFQIALDTFKGSMAAVAESPATFGLPFLPWVIAQGLLQAGLVAAQPIPKYSKGTKDAASRGLFGESGRELMFLKSGDIALADKPTYFEGSKFKGAKIYSNPETEKMIGMSDRHIGGYQITDERLLNELKLTRKAIENKPVAIYDKENRMIGQATSHSQTIYLNKLLHRN